jgi:DNA gyrase/topoisomerase IV subunit B
MIRYLLVCVNCPTLTRESITFTDKENDKDGNFVCEIFHSDEGLKEYIRYLDVNREPIITCYFHG